MSAIEYDLSGKEIPRICIRGAEKSYGHVWKAIETRVECCCQCGRRRQLVRREVWRITGLRITKIIVLLLVLISQVFFWLEVKREREINRRLIKAVHDAVK